MIDEAVLISGIPGAGKTLLAQQLQYHLRFSLLDKDDFLDALLREAGEHASTQRQNLSRTSDALFATAALTHHQVILVSFWHVTGMAHNSGTPTDWLMRGADRIVNVHCDCAPSIAATRFVGRRRHPGHNDAQRSYSDLKAEFETLARLDPPLPNAVRVDSSAPIDTALLVGRIRAALSPL